MTVVYSAECNAPQKEAKTSAMLPILVVLFIVSYGLLTMLVFEQGQTIESQRGLIREMLQDSNQLAALKNKLAHDERFHGKGSATGNQAGQAGSNQAGSGAAAAAPKNSAPNPSDKNANHPGRSTHSTKEAPGKPASDLDDIRRQTNVT